MAKGLGKGIQAFFPELTVDDDVKEQISEIKISQCRPNPYQPRKTFQVEAIEELKQSILTYGIIQPLLVRKAVKGYDIIAGERRYRAAKEAGLKTIPVIVKEMDDQRMMELALLENLQRENLTAIEEAQAYVNLIKTYKITQDELAQKFGKSRSHITNLMRLLQLPVQITAMINNGELSMGHGRALLALKDKSLIDQVSRKITTENLNVRQVEQYIKQLNTVEEVKKKQKVKKDIFVVEQESILRQRLGTSVTINQGKKKGKIEISYYNASDLERILSLLNDGQSI